MIRILMKLSSASRCGGNDFLTVGTFRRFYFFLLFAIISLSLVIV